MYLDHLHCNKGNKDFDKIGNIDIYSLQVTQGFNETEAVDIYNK